MLRASDLPCLLVIDPQRVFGTSYYGERNNPQAEIIIRRLIQEWRAHKLNLIFVKHQSVNPESPFHPDNMTADFIETLQPLANEPVIYKSVNSAFIGTDLESVLLKLGCQNLWFAGFTTDHCVSTTVRMAANLGYRCGLIADATATFPRSLFGKVVSAQDVHVAALASLNDEFCTVRSSEEVIAALRH